MAYNNVENKNREDCELISGVWNQQENACKIQIHKSENILDSFNRVGRNIKELAAPTKELVIKRSPQNNVYVKKDEDSPTGYSATCDECSTEFPIEKSVNTNSFIIGKELSRERDYVRIIDTAKRAVPVATIVVCPHCGIAAHLIPDVL
jgi:hypothetical protein